MHRTLVSAALLVMTLAIGATDAYAQTDRPRWGALGHISIGTLDWSANPGFDLSHLVRGGGGVTLEVPLGDTWALDLRAALAPKGVVGVQTAEGQRLSGTIAAHYVTFPAFLKVRAPGRAAPYVMAGPELGLRVRSRYKLDFAGEVERGSLDEDFRRFDVALAVGGGVDLGRLFVEGVYSHGLRDVGNIFSSLMPEAGLDERLKTRTFTIGVGVRF